MPNEMTMLERAAKAAGDAAWESMGSGLYPHKADIAIARAVIASLRQPSEAVCSAMNFVEGGSLYLAAQQWENGIDAILTEEGETR